MMIVCRVNKGMSWLANSGMVLIVGVRTWGMTRVTPPHTWVESDAPGQALIAYFFTPLLPMWASPPWGDMRRLIALHLPRS